MTDTSKLNPDLDQALRKALQGAQTVDDDISELDPDHLIDQLRNVVEIHGLEITLRGLRYALAQRALYMAKVEQNAHAAKRWLKVSSMMSLLIEASVGL